MDKKIIIIIILSIIIIVGLGFFLIPEYNNIQQIKGVKIGQEQVIIQINQQGTIPITQQKNNQTFVEWVGIQEICSWEIK